MKDKSARKAKATKKDKRTRKMTAAMKDMSMVAGAVSTGQGEGSNTMGTGKKGGKKSGRASKKGNANELATVNGNVQ